MSWSDPCGSCGEHRADCDCKSYNGTIVIKENNWIECDECGLIQNKDICVPCNCKKYE